MNLVKRTNISSLTLYDRKVTFHILKVKSKCRVIFLNLPINKNNFYFNTEYFVWSHLESSTKQSIPNIYGRSFSTNYLNRRNFFTIQNFWYVEFETIKFFIYRYNHKCISLLRIYKIDIFIAVFCYLLK